MEQHGGEEYRECREDSKNRVGHRLGHFSHLFLYVIKQMVYEIGEQAEVFALGREFHAVYLNPEASVEFVVAVFFENDIEADFGILLFEVLEVGIEFASNVGVDETIDSLVILGLNLLQVLLDLDRHMETGKG
jgi:hypothetical protein